MSPPLHRRSDDKILMRCDYALLSIIQEMNWQYFATPPSYDIPQDEKTLKTTHPTKNKAP
jgi:hypothetical protein